MREKESYSERKLLFNNLKGGIVKTFIRQKRTKNEILAPFDGARHE